MNFIDWATQQLEDHYEDRIFEALKGYVEFTELPKDYVTKKVIEKLKESQAIYGSPEKGKKIDVLKEVESEHIDTIGWRLADDYQKLKASE